VTITPAGNFTGKLQFLNTSLTLSGKFDEEGRALFGSARLNSLPVTQGMGLAKMSFGNLTMNLDFDGEYPAVVARVEDVYNSEITYSQGIAKSSVQFFKDATCGDEEDAVGNIQSGLRERGVHRAFGHSCGFARRIGRGEQRGEVPARQRFRKNFGKPVRDGYVFRQIGGWDEYELQQPVVGNERGGCMLPCILRKVW
jgi:hypothetical protein